MLRGCTWQFCVRAVWALPNAVKPPTRTVNLARGSADVDVMMMFTPLAVVKSAMSVLLSCLLSVASSHPVVLRTRLGRGLCRSVTLRAVSCCAQHTSLAEQRCTPGTSRKARTLN